MQKGRINLRRLQKFFQGRLVDFQILAAVASLVHAVNPVVGIPHHQKNQGSGSIALE